jgi:hypothetical protein
MPRIGSLGVKDFELVQTARSKVLRVVRDGVSLVLFFDSGVPSQHNLLNVMGSCGMDPARAYALDVKRFRAVAASSLGSSTEIRSTPKIIAYVDGTPVKMFAANLPKTAGNIRGFAESVLAENEDVEEDAPPPPRRGGARSGRGAPPPRRTARAPVYEEDPDDGTEFIVPPGIKPHNTPWVEAEDEF